MSEHRKKSATRLLRKPGVVFYALLIAISWRLVDLLDETIAGEIKMSLGKFMLEGQDALFMQSLIIAILTLSAYRIGKRDPAKKMSTES